MTTDQPNFPNVLPQVFASGQPHWRRMDIDLIWDTPEGQVIAQVDLRTEPMGTYVPEDERGGIFKGDWHQGRAVLQAFMDEAFRMGLRPTGIDDMAGELRATKAHRDDLRSLLSLDGGTFRAESTKREKETKP